MSYKMKYSNLRKLILPLLEDIDEHLSECSTLLSYFVKPQNRKTQINSPFVPGKKLDVIIYKCKPINLDIITEKYKILCLCPAKDEISQEIDWYEEDEEVDSFKYQLACIYESTLRDELIKNNLTMDARPVFEKTINEWHAQDTSDYHASAPKKIESLSFAPVEGQTIQEAYLGALKSRKKTESRYRQNLLYRYIKNLSESMLEGFHPDDPLRECSVRERDKILFGQQIVPLKQREGRWKQSYAIDHVTAGKCLEWLLNQFLRKGKQSYLEAACVIWILIWVGHEVSYTITAKEVLHLTKNQIQANRQIQFSRKNELEVSEGLHSLLRCIKRDGNKENPRLFQYLKNEKSLERIFHQISIALGIAPILPSVFCLPCHSIYGKRLPPLQAKALKQGRNLVPFSARKLRIDLKKIITQSFSKK